MRDLDQSTSLYTPLKCPLITLLISYFVFSMAVWLGKFTFTVYGYYPFTHDVPVFLQFSLYITHTKVKHWQAGVNSPGTAAVIGCGSVWPGVAAAAVGSWSPLDFWAMTEGHTFKFQSKIQQPQHLTQFLNTLKTMSSSLGGRTETQCQTCSLRNLADACK